MLQFPGGHANLTYLLRFGPRELVLRRPPFGPVAPGAHDMVREHKVLSRLWEHFAAAPRAYLFCEDQSVIGARFFVMERRRGVVVRSGFPSRCARTPTSGGRVSFALVDAMAELHDVDYEKAGLADLGKPEGFVERQVAGWKRVERSRATSRSRASTRSTRASPRACPPRAARPSCTTT